MGEAAVDLRTFDGYASMLDELRAGPDAGALTGAVEVATRAAAIDTGEIEGLYEVDRGFTMTIARGVAAWEKVIAAREPVVRRSFEDAQAGGGAAVCQLVQTAAESEGDPATAGLVSA